MSKKTLTIAVASDLHAISSISGESRRSHLLVTENENHASVNPIGGLLQLVNAEQLRCDLFISPGDLGDLADPQGIRYAWDALHRVGQRMNAELVLATTGNHDLDSRHLHNEVDAEELLKGLVPPYPFPEESNNNQYWARKFSVWERPLYRLIALNSSAYHIQKQQEQERGRISKDSLVRIKNYLDSSEIKLLNVCICHHHPQQHSELNLGDYDWMREGQQLLDLLGAGNYGAWIVIHGHKHHPKITYASGGLNSPIVFSAGSLSAVLYPELGTAARNQFYLLFFDVDDLQKFGIVGVGRAWDWAATSGWVKASKGSGLPSTFGFGWRENLRVVSDQIAGQMSDRKTMGWQSLASALPKVKFILPSDLKALNATLVARHAIEIVYDENATPYQLGRRAGLALHE